MLGGLSAGVVQGKALELRQGSQLQRGVKGGEELIRQAALQGGQCPAGLAASGGVAGDHPVAQHGDRRQQGEAVPIALLQLRKPARLSLAEEGHEPLLGQGGQVGAVLQQELHGRQTAVGAGGEGRGLQQGVGPLPVVRVVGSEQYAGVVQVIPQALHKVEGLRLKKC